MNIDTSLIIFVAGCVWTVALLDDWSTTILLAYKHMLINKEDVKKYYEEKDRKEGVQRYEMNKLARFFFKKYGFMRGKRIMNIVIRYPLFILVCGLALFKMVPFTTFMFFAYFYAGMLMSQIMRASFASKSLKKDMGINLKEYAKENLK
jgi:hypothetical protein